jgi:hypothetical protein
MCEASAARARVRWRRSSAYAATTAAHAPHTRRTCVAQQRLLRQVQVGCLLLLLLLAVLLLPCLLQQVAEAAVHLAVPLKVAKKLGAARGHGLRCSGCCAPRHGWSAPQGGAVDAGCPWTSLMRTCTCAEPASCCKYRRPSAPLHL